MTINVIMPQMGESVFECTLTKWLKKVGDSVKRDEPLFEISTDKVDSEIPSPASGILSAILVPEGKTVQINTVVAIISEGEAVEQKAAEISRERAPAQEIPREALKPESIPPIVTEERAKPEALTPPAAEKRVSTSDISPSIQLQDIRTSPLVRRIARENNVDLTRIKGTGLGGRITKDDLFGYLAQRAMPEVPSSRPEWSDATEPESVQMRAPAAEIPASAVSQITPPSAVMPEMTRFMGESETIPMTPMRKAIADHMVLSKRTSAHVNTVFEVDVSSIVQIRQVHKEEFEKREGVPLTYTPFFAKALVDVVREFPILNSSVVGENIILKKPVNLGVAVALDTGLIVPVIRDAHLKSFTGLALAIYDLAERARNKKLKPDDVQNGTISMTNPGSFGALFATPIISQPQVAILGIGGIEKRPVVINDAIAIRSMVCLSLTFDHRVIDGAVADRFMARLKERLQSFTQWID
jgi:pyruvate dehydrogenase E2 component (dihydrolipoyllysine-residue acetyltransferase)